MVIGLLFILPLFIEIIMGCCHSRNRGAVYKSLLSNSTLNHVTRGNEENAEMLVAFVLREFEHELDLHIPNCINYVCLKYFYENTNVIFHDYDKCNSWNVSIAENGKRLKYRVIQYLYLVILNIHQDIIHGVLNCYPYIIVKH